MIFGSAVCLGLLQLWGCSHEIPMGRKKSKKMAATAAAATSSTSASSADHQQDSFVREDAEAKSAIEAMLAGQSSMFGELDSLASMVSSGFRADEEPALASAPAPIDVAAQRRADEAKRINEMIAKKKKDARDKEVEVAAQAAEEPDMEGVQINATAKNRGQAKVAAKVAGGVFVTQAEWSRSQNEYRQLQEQVKELKEKNRELQAANSRMISRMEALGDEVGDNHSPGSLRASIRSGVSFAKNHRNSMRTSGDDGSPSNGSFGRRSSYSFGRRNKREGSGDADTPERSATTMPFRESMRSFTRRSPEGARRSSAIQAKGKRTSITPGIFRSNTVNQLNRASSSDEDGGSPQGINTNTSVLAQAGFVAQVV